MLPVGSTNARNLWLDIIEGRNHVLRHGYYCTRQPDDAEREAGITMVEARTAEVKFFTDNTPWSTSRQKLRFGTENLVSTLSNLLMQVINERYVGVQYK